VSRGFGVVTARAAVLSRLVKGISNKELMMRVFVAGAMGAIGRQLVPRLVATGNELRGMMRSESKRAMLSGLGAVPMVVDALDPEASGRDSVGLRAPASARPLQGGGDSWVPPHRKPALMGVSR
jgi:hypothetical protein